MNARDNARIYEYRLAPRYRDNLQSIPRSRSMRLSNKTSKHKLANVDPTARIAISRVVHSSQSQGY